MEQFALADDLAITTKASDKKDLLHNSNEALIKLNDWMADQKLNFVAEKAEAMILKRPRKSNDVKKLRSLEIIPSKTLK